MHIRSSPLSAEPLLIFPFPFLSKEMHQKYTVECDVTVQTAKFAVSFFCADSNSSIQEPLQNASSELLTETASKEPHNHLTLDVDNDTESTAL